MEEIPGASQGTIGEYAGFPPLFSALEFAFEDSACEAALVAISVSTVGKGKKGNRLLEMYVQAMATTEAWIEDRPPVLLFSPQFIIPGLPLTNIDPKDKQQIPYFVFCLTIV